MRQVWLVRQLTEHADGRREVEDRHFLTNLRVGGLTAEGILAVVRGWPAETGASRLRPALRSRGPRTTDQVWALTVPAFAPRHGCANFCPGGEFA